MTVAIIQETIDTTVAHLIDGFIAAIPRLISALLVVAVAFVSITIITEVLERVLTKAYPPDESLVVDLIVIIVSVLLWFGVVLTLLKVLGLDEIAAGIGTAVGFIALGISYALSEMIEDTVSGVYLLRDPDFNAGDTIITEKMTGEVLSIGLRKSRFRTEDGDIAVIANRNVESRWTRRIGPQ